MVIYGYEHRLIVPTKSLIMMVYDFEVVVKKGGLKKMTKRMYLLVTLIVLSALFISGCTSSSISGTGIKDIITSPGKYEGSSVSVSGKVILVIADITNPDDMNAFYLKGTSYKINDGSDSIEIISSTAPPKIGDKVTVTGIVFATDKGVYIDTRKTK